MKFNLYPTVAGPASDDTLLIWQDASGKVKQIKSSVATLAALRALSVTNLSDGAIINVLGCESENDGGGGMFFYSLAGVAADDKGTVIKPTVGAGNWLRLEVENRINALWFEGVDIGSKINSAILVASDGGEIYVPRGSYDFSTTININKPKIKLCGDGQSTELHYTGSGNAIYCPLIAEDSKFRITSLWLHGTADTGKGIRVDSGIGPLSIIDNMFINGFSTHIDIGDLPGSNFHLTIRECFIDIGPSTVGVKMVVCNACTITDCFIQGSSGVVSTGVILDKCTNVTIRGGAVQYHGTANIVVRNASYITTIGPGTYLEGDVAGSLYVDVAADTKGITIIGNVFNGNSSVNYGILVRDGAVGVTIVGNRVDDFLTNFIHNLTSSTSVENRIFGFGNSGNTGELSGTNGVGMYLDRDGVLRFIQGLVIRIGSGDPNLNFPGQKGSLFLRYDGGAGTCLYVNEDGTNAGWAPK